MAKKITLDIPDPQQDEEDATEKQRQFIRALMQEAGASGVPEDVIRQLGKWQASAVITQLKSFKDEVEASRTLAPVEAPAKPALSKPLWVFIVVAVIVWLIWIW
jgi:hypothetical protein